VSKRLNATRLTLIVALSHLEGDSPIAILECNFSLRAQRGNFAIVERLVIEDHRVILTIYADFDVTECI